MSKSRVLKIIFRPNLEEVLEDWFKKKLHCEELHVLCSLPYIICVFELKQMR